MKKIIIGKGVAYYKKAQCLKWKDIRDKLEYKTLAATQRIVNKNSGTTALVDRLAHAFGVSPAEFIEQCTTEAGE